MTPTPWAQAVEAMRREQDESGVDANCRCPGNYDALPCDDCLTAMLRAALPHLLRAVTEGMDLKALNGLLCQMDSQYCEEDMRTALLSALTDAAGRVGG